MKIRLYKMLLFVLTILLAPMSYAAQIKPISNNGTTEAYVSNHDLTRIVVVNDRIQAVRGSEEAYQIKTDTNQGAIFIEPTPAFQKKPFTIFLATEQNQDYMLRLIPRNQPADTILLKSHDAQNPVAAHWETASPYTEAITQLMKDMVNLTSPEGYAVDVIAKAKNQHLGVVNLKLIEVYQGAYLQGSIYSVINGSAQTIILNERQFYQTGIRAVALTEEAIAPHGQIFLYRVSSSHE